MATIQYPLSLPFLLTAGIPRDHNVCGGQGDSRAVRGCQGEQAGDQSLLHLPCLSGEREGESCFSGSSWALSCMGAVLHGVVSFLPSIY